MNSDAPWPFADLPRFTEAITFDDVLLIPQRSEVVPDQVDVRTCLSRRIRLSIPLVSSPMDTVTESALAIALAQEGGIGFIHKNLSIEEQCREVGKVKRFERRLSVDPVTLGPDRSCQDARGRLCVGAAVGVHDYKRVEALLAHDVDVIAVDTAHGHSTHVIETVKTLRRQYEVEIVAGNIATGEAARDLIEAGADALKIGVGPGSICTTRVVSGCGVPQLTAIMDVCRVAAAADVPVIADGGIRGSGDITKAIAAGAHCVMMGALFAGVDESPGEAVTWHGRRYKTYRGMGSAGAMMRGSADRYGQKAPTPGGKRVPEGVEGMVPSRGPLADFIDHLVGGLRAGMGYCGAATIDDLRRNAKFCRVTAAGGVESHPHDVTFMKESPNDEIDYPTEP